MWGEQAIEQLLTYFPHFGKKVATLILSENLTEQEVEEKAKELELIRLPKEERLCISCLENMQMSTRTICSVCKTRTDSKDISFKKWTSLLISDIKWRCKKKGMPFNLDVDYLIDQWIDQDGKCFYSHFPMTRGGNSEDGSLHKDYYRGTIDRIDPNEGYIKENTVWCTWACNSGKGHMAIDEYLKVCKAVSENEQLY